MSYHIIYFFSWRFCVVWFPQFEQTKDPPPVSKETQFFGIRSSLRTKCPIFRLHLIHEAWDAMQPLRNTVQVKKLCRLTSNQFKIDTNHFVKGQKLYGRTKLTLSCLSGRSLDEGETGLRIVSFC